MTVELEFLQQVPYFAGISPAELEATKKHIYEKKADRGEIISVGNEPAEALYFVASGVIKVFDTSPEGREQVLSLVRPGESFNDIAIFDGGPNPYSAQAMTAATLYGLRKDDIKVLLLQYPQFAINVVIVLARRLRQMVALVEDLSFRHVVNRVAKVLLENAGDKSGEVKWLTQQEMAAIAGTTREVVGRSLKTLEDRGLIRVQRRRIGVVDERGLREMVETGY